jgi:hypothetical protein
MRDREAIARLLREAADVIEADDLIPVPVVSLHFMAHTHEGVAQPTSVFAAMAQFPIDYAYRVDTQGFLHLTGEVTEGFHVTISGTAAELPAFAAAVLRGEEGAAA